jgi:hypothetical protein
MDARPWAVFSMMKKSRDLIEFLFRDSQQASERDVLAPEFDSIFEEMDKQELEPAKTPLKSALAKLGVDIELQDDIVGFCASTSCPAEYRELRDKLKSPEAMEKLAELGWVVADRGDRAMTGEEAAYCFNFIEIATPEAENAEKVPGRKDLEDIVKDAKEFSFSPKKEQPEPKAVKGGVGKTKPGGKAEKAIKDSQRSRLVRRLLDE